MTVFSLHSNISLLSILICSIHYPLSGQVESDAIKNVITAYAEARAASSPEEIRQLFTDDADQLVSSGEWRHGMEALVEGMLRSSRNNPGKRSLIVETIRFISTEVVLADARYEIIRTDGSERKMWSTFILKKEANQWKIAAIRNMLPAP